eukprot:CAMPEP_0172912778 /NCGR_PEP_ID=MMETSP1075-20121228/189100_1 /TAXON_ID=2916 /ORGANISM="Ceratium fusus, Strain PA161109" /LENGTH=219 /DNA_ID=CAMNT_0013771349 /DNA_START=209 /DNA_END=865 /DNA_ORIENTATION=+
MAVAVIFGSVLAAVERWDAYLGIEYVLSNILGMQSPLTAIIPETATGKILNVLMSVWALLCATTALGIAAGMCLVQYVSAMVPDSIFGFLRYLLLYIPVVLMLIACVTGGFLAIFEEWTFEQGFLYMVSSVAGLANPIVNLEVTTAEGAFVECLCICIELGLGGAIIGVVCSHPIVGRFILYFEGEAVAIEDESKFDESEKNANIADTESVKNANTATT